MSEGWGSGHRESPDLPRAEGAGAGVHPTAQTVAPAYGTKPGSTRILSFLGQRRWDGGNVLGEWQPCARRPPDRHGPDPRVSSFSQVPGTTPLLLSQTCDREGGDFPSSTSSGKLWSPSVVGGPHPHSQAGVPRCGGPGSRACSGQLSEGSLWGTPAVCRSRLLLGLLSNHSHFSLVTNNCKR